MSDVDTSNAVAPEGNPSRVRRCVYLLVVVVLLGLLAETPLWRPDTLFGLRDNVQIAEAQAWWSGQLDLPERRWDTALSVGKVYSYFPDRKSVV